MIVNKYLDGLAWSMLGGKKDVWGGLGPHIRPHEFPTSYKPNQLNVY